MRFRCWPGVGTVTSAVPANAYARPQPACRDRLVYGNWPPRLHLPELPPRAFYDANNEIFRTERHLRRHAT
jgi:hypothetical protein